MATSDEPSSKGEQRQRNARGIISNRGFGTRSAWIAPAGSACRSGEHARRGRYFGVSRSWSEYRRSAESRNLGFGSTPTFPVVGSRRALDIGSIGFASERLPKITRVSEIEISTLDIPV